MQDLKSFSFFLAGLLFLASCATQQKMPQYLEGISNETINGQTNFPELVIQKNDQLAIQVFSEYLPKDPNPDLLYNQPTPTGGTSGSGTNSGTTSVSGGYLVDVDGNIDYPRLGKIHAAGLTKKQLENEIKKRLTTPVELLKNPSVIIRFQSYKVTTIGEFNAPQVLNIPTEKLTIFEAVSMSGGITEWGRKDSVKIIREQDGKRETGIVNLSSPAVFSSPYYYLKQNDILLIDPINDKARSKDEARTLSRFTFATALVSAAAVIVSLVLAIK